MRRAGIADQAAFTRARDELERWDYLAFTGDPGWPNWYGIPPLAVEDSVGLPVGVPRDLLTKPQHLSLYVALAALAADEQEDWPPVYPDTCTPSHDDIIRIARFTTQRQLYRYRQELGQLGHIDYISKHQFAPTTYHLLTSQAEEHRVRPFVDRVLAGEG